MAENKSTIVMPSTSCGFLESYKLRGISMRFRWIPSDVLKLNKFCHEAANAGRRTAQQAIQRKGHGRTQGPVPARADADPRRTTWKSYSRFCSNHAKISPQSLTRPRPTDIVASSSEANDVRRNKQDDGSLIAAVCPVQWSPVAFVFPLGIHEFLKQTAACCVCRPQGRRAKRVFKAQETP